jgi:hypothetical protein
MSRALFMAKLKEGLSGLSPTEVEEIVSDYEFHFAEAGATGQSEDDVVARLGNPASLARELREELEQRRSDATAGKSSLVVAPSWLRRSGDMRPLLALLFAAGVVASGGYYLIGRHFDDATALRSTSLSAAGSPNPSRQPATGTPASLSAAPKVVITGGQDLDLGSIMQERIEVVIDGGGHVKAKGQVKEFTLRIDGSGTADFGGLQADIVHLGLSGTGNAQIAASQSADVTISGSGTVRLKTKPKLLTQSITGSGRLMLPN